MIAQWSALQVVSSQSLLRDSSHEILCFEPVSQRWPRAFGGQQCWVPHLVGVGALNQPLLSRLFLLCVLKKEPRLQVRGWSRLAGNKAPGQDNA